MLNGSMWNLLLHILLCYLHYFYMVVVEYISVDHWLKKFYQIEIFFI